MGWTGRICTLDEMIAEARSPWKYSDTRTAIVIDQSWRSGCDWTVREYREGDRLTGERFIVATLIQRSRSGECLRKEVSEDMGPCRYDCPLRFLDLVAEPASEYAKAWRARVRAHRSRLARKLLVGGTYAVLGCSITSVRVTSLRPLLGIGSDGRQYRIPRTRLGEAIACVA